MAAEPRPGERVYHEIKHAILAGEFALQQRLDIDRLADQFGVSATPVRHALAILSSERLVRIHASRTYRVAFWSERELRDLYEWRYQLARWAAETFAASASPAAPVADHSYVGAYLGLMQRLDPGANSELRRAARAADDRLHAALRVEPSALGDSATDLAPIEAAMARGGSALSAALRKHFRRRIAHCDRIRSAAHATAMPRNGE